MFEIAVQKRRIFTIKEVKNIWESDNRKSRSGSGVYLKLARYLDKDKDPSKI